MRGTGSAGGSREERREGELGGEEAGRRREGKGRWGAEESQKAYCYEIINSPETTTSFLPFLPSPPLLLLYMCTLCMCACMHVCTHSRIHFHFSRSNNTDNHDHFQPYNTNHHTNSRQYDAIQIKMPSVLSLKQKIYTE